MRKKSPAPADRERKYARKLSEELKAYVVRRLASYDSSTAIARDLKELFGVEVALPTIDYYHPERVSSLKLPPCWQELFWETRRAFIAACTQASTMEQMVRVRLREDMVLMARDAGHYRSANELLDSIAKEAGKMFTSRHTLAQAAAPVGRATVIYEYDDCTDVSHGDAGAPSMIIRMHGPKNLPPDGADFCTGAPGPSDDDACPVPEPAPRRKT
jgi:hypothetical protein